jgi:hypothetical protein
LSAEILLMGRRSWLQYGPQCLGRGLFARLSKAQCTLATSTSSANSCASCSFGVTIRFNQNDSTSQKLLCLVFNSSQKQATAKVNRTEQYKICSIVVNLGFHVLNSRWMRLVLEAFHWIDSSITGIKMVPPMR